MLAEAYLEPSRTWMMKLFSLQWSHILKTYNSIELPLGSIFYTIHPFVKKLATLKTSGESLVNNGTFFFFLKLEIMQWSVISIISKKGFLN